MKEVERFQIRGVTGDIKRVDFERAAMIDSSKGMSTTIL